MQSMPGMDHKPDGANPIPEVKHESSAKDSMPGMNHSAPIGRDLKSRPDKDGGPNPKSAIRNPKTYVCPMHPHEMSHNPKDKCKICGMDLVEKK
jgi:uncharacterized protein involved in copper resistance